MPIRSFDWGQAVLNKRLKQATEKLSLKIPEKGSPRPPLTLLSVWLRQITRMVVGLCLVGIIFLFLFKQFSQKLEAVISDIEDTYRKLRKHVSTLWDNLIPNKFVFSTLFPLLYLSLFVFAETGVYTIACSAEDGEGNVSADRTGTVYQYGSGDEYEPDDGPGDATLAVIDWIAQDHNFHDQGDEDWAWFFAEMDVYYSIYVTTTGPSCNPVLRLYSELDTGTPIEEVDDGIAAEGEMLLWQSPANGVYYISVHNYEPTDVGYGTEYQLRIINEYGAFNGHAEALPSCSEVRLTWVPSGYPGTQGFNIYFWSPEPKGDPILLDVTSATEYLHTNLGPHTPYFYQISEIDGFYHEKILGSHFFAVTCETIAPTPTPTGPTPSPTTETMTLTPTPEGPLSTPTPTCTCCRHPTISQVSAYPIQAASGEIVTLEAQGSSCLPFIYSCGWYQRSGPMARFIGPAGSGRDFFVVPYVETVTFAVFEYYIFNSNPCGTSDSATLTVTFLPPPTPTDTPTDTPTRAPTETRTETPVTTATSLPTLTPTQTPTNVPTATNDFNGVLDNIVDAKDLLWLFEMIEGGTREQKSLFDFCQFWLEPRP